jgi:signal transduction histidine kinase
MDQKISETEAQTGVAPPGRLSRLALDIHDGPLQNLAVIGLDLNALHGRIRSLLPASARNQVDAGVEQIAEDLFEVERSLRALLGALERDGAGGQLLLEGIHAEIAEFRRRSGVVVEVLTEGNVEPLAASVREALQAIVRSALANIAKHAEATAVTIRVSEANETISLEIEDDGRGFDLGTAYRPGHFGLLGIQARAELAGGHAEILSRPGGPTIVRATACSWAPDAVSRHELSIAA